MIRSCADVSMIVLVQDCTQLVFIIWWIWLILVFVCS